MGIEFTQENFQTEVLNSEKPVLVDFWATWCMPCQKQGPIVDQVSQKMGDKAVVGKLNVESANEIAAKYGVMAIPTLIIFKGGEVAERLVGLQTEPQIIDALNKHI